MVGGVLGSYRVLSEIGRGGMGAVYLAEHTLIGKRAAAKVLLPQFSRDPAIVERFFNEARATTQIRHPGIVEVFDFGYHDGGCAYLVMEFLEGESLAQRLTREGGRLDETTLVEVTRQLASALRSAHDKKIVHRDLKPDNAFLVPDADLPMGVRVKVLDFGIAKLSGDNERGNKTRTGTVMGTPAYMSPEQCRGAGGVDARSDVYSLGCMMFEMASGRTPFIGEGPGDILGAHIFSEVPVIHAFAPSLSPGIAQLITQMLQKAPDARPPSMGDVLARIEALGFGRGSAPRLVSPVFTAPEVALKSDGGAHTISSAPVSTTMGGAAAEMKSRPPEKRPGGRVPVLLTLVGCAAVGGWYMWGPARHPAAAPPPPLSEPKIAANEPVVTVPAVPAAPVAAPPAAPPHVKLVVDSQPTGAEVFIDGARVGKTPWTDERDKSPEDAVYVLKLHGFYDQRVRLPSSKMEPSRSSWRESPGRSLSQRRNRNRNRPPSPPPSTSRPSPARTRSSIRSTKQRSLELIEPGRARRVGRKARARRIPRRHLTSEQRSERAP